MTFKRILCMCLCILLSVSALTVRADANSSSEAIEETQVLQSPKEQEVLKILIIGNSHSVDAFHLLYEAYKDQLPEQEIVLGVLYYSGCSISMHVNFGTKNEPVYRYYKNSSGKWAIQNGVTMKSVLQDQLWDLVLIQAAIGDLNETYNASGRRKLEAIVTENIPTPHEFGWHTSWASSNDETFYSEDYVRQPPDGYKNAMTKLFGFNPVNHFTVLTDKAKAHILTDNHYLSAVCSGAGIMYAYLELGCTQLDLWRDYTHLSDFGRLVAAYSLFAQLTGQPIEEIHIDTIPASMRHSQYRELGDMTVTEEMKQIIIMAANHSLEDPWTVPGQ